MFLVLALFQALAAAQDPVLAGALFCIGEQALPETFVRDTPDKQIWRLAGPQIVLVSRMEPTCLVTRIPVGVTETAVGAWIEARSDFQLDKDQTAGGVRTREYVRKSDSGGQRLRLFEPFAPEYPAFSPPSGLVVWPENASK